MAVAAQEIGQPEHVGIALVADDDRPGAGFDQPDAAQDQRAHDPLAEVGFGDSSARSRPAESRPPRRRSAPRVDQRRPAGQLRELAHEIAALVGDDVVALAAVRAG